MTYKDYQTELLPTLPDDPGVYRFLDEEGTILYVGKAKNLRNRLGSYFTSGKNTTHKTKLLLRNSERVEFTMVETESDALLLENTLIKRYQPRYNVRLKDAKSYSYICIKKERFPRVFLARKVFRDGSQYFGPYMSRTRIKIILDLINELFQLRNCTLNLSEDNIKKGKFKVCLQYHIKNCLAPCVGYEEEAEYNKKIEQIKNILKGNFASVRRHFTEEMERLSANLEFEKAQDLKIKLNAFTDYQGKSTVVNPAIKDVDVFSIATDDKYAYVNYLKIVNGAIINTYTQELEKNLNEEEASLLSYSIPEIRNKFNSIAPELIVPFEISLAENDLKITVPKIGDKRSLLDLSEKNVRYHLLQKRKEEINRTRRQTSAERILSTLKYDLNMKDMPLHIECFDNSNLQGSYPVSSCVVFKNAKPSKKDYRHYNIKTVVGPDDFASMEEVVYRRYKRLLNEDKSLPQLIIIDGGKGQLSSAVKSLNALGILDKLVIVGVAKRLEEIFFPGDSIPLYINKKSESLKLIQHARNEAHRFAINFHRNKRSKDFTKTELTDIPGIGEVTAQKLLTHFGSVRKIQKATREDLENAVGKSNAGKVLIYFGKSNEEEEEE